MSELLNDDVLIHACSAVLSAHAASHAACDGPWSVAMAHADRCRALLTPMLAMQAHTLEGIRAKAGVAAAFCDLSSEMGCGDRLIASLLADLGAAVPEGFAAA